MDIIRMLIYLSIFIGFFTAAYYLLSFSDRKKSFKPIKELPFCSIIIPAYNEEDSLAKTVESVLKLNYPKEKYEIIIVNDGSKDKTEEIAKNLENKYGNVRAFTKKNGGKGSALNFGIKKAKGEIVLSLDADSMVTENALIYMIPYFADPEVMSVAPALKVYKPRGILQRVQAIEYDLGIFLRKAFSNLNAIHVTPGPFSAYRKIFFEKHGGYDESNITEDMEIAMRIQSLNYKIANSPKSLVYTISPGKIRELTRQRRRWYFGMLFNFNKYRNIFGKKYGELGVIILPLALFSILTVMIITSYFIFRGISDAIENLSLYSLINYDFINNFEFKSYIFSLSFYRLLSETLVLFGLFFAVFSVLLLIYINKKVKSVDRPVSTFINYIFFMIFYSLLFSFWWLISIVYYFTSKKIEW